MATAPAPPRYERGEPIGAGGVGQVFHGRQIALGREVALKEIRGIFDYFPASRRSAIVEQIREVAQTNARLQHPFITKVYDLSVDDEFPLIVMEYCPGGSLRERMVEQGRLEPKEAVQLFAQVAEGLAFAHRDEVLHRNLKPENILFDRFGNAKISDFGMTRIAERGDQRGQQFYMGMSTVAYLPPEQFQNPTAVSEQGDLYALGIILYEMLTGKLPGRRSRMPSECFQDIPPDLDDIFDRMTMDFLDERYTSVDEVLLDFYRSPAVMALLRTRGPSLFTDTDLSSLPELTEAIPRPPMMPQRPSPPPRMQRRPSQPTPPPPQYAAPEEQHHGGLHDMDDGHGEPAEAPRRSRRSRRLGRMAEDLFGD